MELMENLYNNISLPSGLSGLKKLYDAAKALDSSITQTQVKDFLQTKDSYTLHRITQKKFMRRKIIAPKPKVIVSVDLGDMTRLSQHNQGFKYMLVVIDSFSRYLKVALLRNKKASTVLQELRRILESPEFNGVSRIHADKGGEFYNKKLLDYLKSKKMTLYSVSSYEIKAAIAERVIQTIKRKLYKYLTHNNTLKYTDALPTIVTAYNNSIHSTLGATPSEVHAYNSPKKIEEMFYHLYKTAIPKDKHLSRPTLTLGSTVRLSGNRNIFSRGFYIQNTIEIFKITHVDRSQHPTVFKIEDLGGEPVDGIFYREELIPTTLPDVFPISILKKKKVNNKLMYFIRWLGYPDKFNIWVSAKDLKKL